MAKITLAQAQEILKELNVAVEVVADEKEADKDVVIADIVEATTAAIKDELMPDIEAEVMDKVDKASLGKSLDLIRQQITKIFSIPRKDLNGLSEKEMMELVKSKSETDDKSKDFESEKQSLIDDYESQLEALRTEKETEVSAERRKYIDRDISAYFVDLASKTNRKDGDLTEHAELLETKFRKQYEIEWDEANKKPIFKKDGAIAKVGTKALDPAIEANAIFERVGLLAKDTRHIDPSKVENPTKTDTPKVRTGIKQLPIQNPNARALAEQLDGE